jgi:hypothetical protein
MMRPTGHIVTGLAERDLLQKSGGNGIFPPDTERLLHRRIVHLRKVCFRLARKHYADFPLRYSKNAESVESAMPGKDSLIASPTKNPTLSLNKQENASYGHSIIFST